MAYRETAIYYTEWFENVLNSDQFRIVTQPISPQEFQFTIVKNDTQEMVGTTKLHIFLNEEYSSRMLRSKRKLTVNGMYISWIEINDKFQGRGLATKLLLYAICNVYAVVPHNYTYITLEDATDSNLMSMDKNIYNRLGFVPAGHVALSNIKGEMKSINADGAKITTIDHLFKTIVPKTIVPIKIGGGKRKIHRCYKKRTVKRKHRKYCTHRTQRTQRTRK